MGNQIHGLAGILFGSLGSGMYFAIAVSFKQIPLSHQEILW